MWHHVFSPKQYHYPFKRRRLEERTERALLLMMININNKMSILNNMKYRCKKPWRLWFYNAIFPSISHIFISLFNHLIVSQISPRLLKVSPTDWPFIEHRADTTLNQQLTSPMLIWVRHEAALISWQCIWSARYIESTLVGSPGTNTNTHTPQTINHDLTGHFMHFSNKP